MKRLLLIILLGWVCLPNFGQDDTEFWFVAPEITSTHGDNPVRVRVTALDEPAIVEIYTQSNLVTPYRTINLAAQESDAEFLPKNDVENSPINMVNNKGIYIKSTAKINAYYELDKENNMDIFALKGVNSLGTTFFTPFSDRVKTGGSDHPNARSSIDIIATQNNTQITISPTNGVEGRANNNPFTITLNRGQTYSIRAASQDPDKHLGGTSIVSTKPIAVTVTDDSMRGTLDNMGGCMDTGGDQLIPVNILGRRYIVMRGKVYPSTGSEALLADGTHSGEYAYVMAIVDGTVVEFTDGGGKQSITLNKGKTHAFPLKYNSTYIRASEQVYVYHISGFQCEMGAAVLPSIEKCTGSQEVTVVKTMPNYDFFINLMVPLGNEDAFEIVYDDGSVKPIPASWFEPVIGSGDTTNNEPVWMVLKSDKKKLYDDFKVNVPAKIRNKEGIFHLGVIQGKASSGCKYGYFSSFVVTDDRAYIVGTTPTDQLSNITKCYGELIQFRAYGGVARDGKPAYEWFPKDYLSDPYVSNPWLVNAPPGDYTYRVNITRPICFSDTFRTLTVKIYPEVKADFTTQVNKGCSPLQINFTNNSIGATHLSNNAYRWKFSYPGGIDTLVNETPGNYKKTFSRIFRNTSDTVQSIQVTLTVRNSDGCTHAITRVISVYPEIKAKLIMNPPNPAIGCNPITVAFTNSTTAGGSLLTLSRYFWEFGDSTYSNEPAPVHLFTNTTASSVTYKTRLVYTTPQNCVYRDSSFITVYPYFEANFTVDSIKGCDPLKLNFTNVTQGPSNLQYLWTITSKNGNSLPPFIPSQKNIGPLTFDILDNSLIPDTFTVSLRVQHGMGTGCPQTVVKKIAVNPVPQTAFSVTGISYPANCAPPTVTFKNDTPDGTPSKWNYYWNFGDSTSSSAQDPSHVYQNFAATSRTYTVKLTASSGQQCGKTVQRLVTINPTIKARMNLPETDLCHGDTVIITYAGQGNVNSIVWTTDATDRFYQQISGDFQTLKLAYNNTSNLPITKNIKLKITNAQGCVDSMVRVITIYPQARAGFTLAKMNENICKPVQVDFANSSNSVAINYLWDFGDGSTSTAKDPSHVYENYTSSKVRYPVRLDVSTAYGCKAFATDTVDIHPIIKAVIGLDSAAACSGVPIKAINKTIGTIVPPPVWKYENSGGVTESGDKNTVTLNYTNITDIPYTRWIRMIVRNSGICVDSVTRIVTIYPKSTANFTFTKVAENICKPLQVQFTNQSNAASTTFNWNFGDGATSSAANPTHIFQNFDLVAKDYPVKLITSTQYNCKDSITKPVKVHPIVKAQFDIDIPETCSNNTITAKYSSQGPVNNFRWEFQESAGATISADKKTVSLVYPNTTDASYTRWIRLIVENTAGCSDTVIRTITIHPRPRVAFTANPTGGCQPLNVSFNNTTNAVATYYEWNFGDGGTSNDYSPTHRFERLKDNDTTYTVRLRAISNKGCDASATAPVLLRGQLVASFDLQQNEACSGQPFSIVNSSKGKVDTYDWDFDGDGSSATPNAQFTHVFTNPGPNPVTRTITLSIGNKNCSAQAQRSIIIYPNPVTAFSADKTEGCQPLTVTFTNIQASPGALYQWNFGDSATSIEYNPKHTFSNLTENEITYTVTLKAQYAEHCKADTSINITVYAHVQAGLDVNDADICSDKPITVSNGSFGQIDPNKYEWFYDWANDKTADSNRSERDYEYTYRNSSDTTRNYRMLLIARNARGCTDTAYRDIRIFPIPKVKFEPSSNQGCQPFFVTFDNRTINGHTYFWDFGDGGNSSEFKPDHTFKSLVSSGQNYNVRLWATSAEGCIGYKDSVIRVAVSPQAAFWVDPSSQHFPDATFNLINSTTPGDWTYFWEFDDGTTSDLKNPPQHSYSLIGAYDIKLTASNEFCSTSFSARALIKPPFSSTLIDTSIVSCPPITVQFNNLLRGNNFNWDFGDGITSTIENPVHTFTEPGTFHVKMSSDFFGAQQFQYQTVIIHPMPKADFRVQPETVMLPDDIMQCSNTSELNYYNVWYFGDGTTSTERHPKHRYTETGKKDIALVVWTEYGCRDSVYRPEAVEVIQGGELIFPNSFIPSLSGPSGGVYDPTNLNPTHFFPYHKGIGEYKLQIYNRWGELLFESEDINIGWDGYHKGKLCKQDVYIYKAKGRYLNGKNFMKTGDVTLFHTKQN